MVSVPTLGLRALSPSSSCDWLGVKAGESVVVFSRIGAKKTLIKVYSAVALSMRTNSIERKRASSGSFYSKVNICFQFWEGKRQTCVLFSANNA